MHYDEVELLAPAGKWSVLEEVALAGADAVYLGGKRLNMRMLRPEFNFSPQELIDAAKFLHDRNKKLYITINNLYYDNELDEIRDYLKFLQEVKVDALILQDMAVVNLCRELDLDIPLHASVQMGIGSSAAAKFLETHGFSRAILSKNLSLDEIQSIHQNSGLFIEYFAHGDLCISHTGQCYMSSFLTAASGNRGACIKPCRWKYSVGEGAASADASYCLAHNDLCLYPHLKELLDVGVRSFKIEGRMRESDYVAHLVKIYRQALDRIIANPDGPVIEEAEMQELQKRRIRDFTTGNLFERPGRESIGSSGEREPVFLSTAFKLKGLSKENYNDYDMGSLRETDSQITIPKLSVKVGGRDSLKQICSLGVDAIILGYEQISSNETAWNKFNIAEALTLVKNCKTEVMVETPRIVTESDLRSIIELKELAEADGLSGFMVNDYGSLQILKATGLKLYGGPGLNVTNSAAAGFLQQNGLSRLTASLELEWSKLKELLGSGIEMDIMAHGPLCGMVTDYCLPRAISEDEDGLCLSPCLNANFALYDEHGQKYVIKTDQKCRNYLYYPFDLCLFAELPLLAAAGLRHIRIDGQYYNESTLQQTVEIYLEACRKIGRQEWGQRDNYNNLLDIFPQGLTQSPVFTVN
ncbi:MAG: U32 family peptidase [Syntrophomonas sp.]